MKTIFLLVLALGIAGATVVQYSHDKTSDPPTFRTLPVSNGDLFVGVTATGTVEPTQIIDVGAQIIGSVTSFGPDRDRPGKTVDYRTQVRKGDLLAKLDDVPYRAELGKAKVALQMADAELIRSRARQVQTAQILERSKKLGSVNTPQDREKFEAEDAVAKAEVALYEAKVEHAKVAKEQAESNLAYTVIRSPIDGVIIDRRVNVGQTVVAGMNAPSLFLLATDLSKMQIWAAVNEADIGVIHNGQEVTFTVDSFRDRVFNGKVSQIRHNASLQQNVVTYGVIVDADNADGKLLPYMTAKLQFEVARRRNVTLVPHQALRWKPTLSQISLSARVKLTAQQTGANQQGKRAYTSEDGEAQVDLGIPAVWKVGKDGLVEPVPVQIGLSDGLQAEIVGLTLSAGEKVVTGVEPRAERDFVSSFVSKVTSLKE